MKDKISQLINRRKAMEIEIERLAALNTPQAAALIVKIKKRYMVLDKKIARLWE
jgi:hypothetical protein